MDVLAWYDTLPDPLKQVLLGLASKVAGNLLDAGGYVVKKAFRSEPKQQALDHAMAQALLVTAGKLTDDPDLIMHYVGLLAAWTEREEVAGELSQLVEPRPEAKLDLNLLTASFEALDFEPELLHEELEFAQVVAIFASAFYDASAQEQELQGSIEIGLLKGIAEQTTRQVEEEIRQTNELKKQTNVLETIVDLLGRGYGNKPEQPTVSELRQATRQYLKYLNDRYHYLDFRGMGVSDRLPLRLPLVQMYVPLKARIELPEGETWARDLRLAGKPMSQEEIEEVGQRLSKPTPVVELLQRYDGLIVLGDPGAGKTTFLKYLTLMLARGEGESLGLGNRLPVLVPLSAYANALAAKDIPLDEFIAAYHRNQGVRFPLLPMMTAALEQGTALILLDGLDEVRSQAQRRTVVDAVTAFFTVQRARGNKFVISSRIIGYREVRPVVEGLGECTLVDFDEAEIREFVEKWTAAVERAAVGDTAVATFAAQREREELLHAVERNAGVRRLAANPLLLTILALMKRQNVVLPERRVELYQQYVETLLKHWNLARGLGRSEERELNVGETLRVLAPLALWMHETSPGVGLVQQQEVRRQLARIYRERSAPEPEQAAAAFLADVRDYAGLLLERGARAYGFIHLTFQEYLAAIAIAQRGQQSVAPVVEALAQRMNQETWHEVSLLSVAHIGIIQQREEAASAVLSGLLAQCTPESNRAAILAGEVLCDVWPSGVTIQAHDEVVAILNKSMIDVKRHARQRLDAGLLLARLDIDPPGLDDFIPALDQPRGELDEPPWGFHIARYPVTNKQYRRFVDAGGYELDKPWWTEKAIEDIKRFEGGKWPNGPRLWGNEKWDQSTQPVVGVSWYEANAYCAWLTAELRAGGRIGDDREVRLPTQAQWMQAAGKAAYPWGKDFDPALANTKESDLGQTTPVHMYPGGQTTEGVWDMSGNVWEWTSDDDGDTKNLFYYLKGGSLYYDASQAAAAARDVRAPNPWYDVDGFRCVVVPRSS